MTILLKGSGKAFRNRVAVFAFAVVLFAPVAAFCQDQQEETDLIEEQTSGNSSIWQDGTTTTPVVGTPDRSDNSSSTPQVNPVGSATISRGGPQITDTDPGGNPDVPFDSNMNIAFLLSGILFSYVVLRKRLKPTPLKVKN